MRFTDSSFDRRRIAASLGAGKKKAVPKTRRTPSDGTVYTSAFHRDEPRLDSNGPGFSFARPSPTSTPAANCGKIGLPAGGMTAFGGSTSSAAAAGCPCRKALLSEPTCLSGSKGELPCVKRRGVRSAMVKWIWDLSWI
jgi:hypothetical protein